MSLLLEASKFADVGPSNVGAFSFRGRMIDRPIIKQAQRITNIASHLNLSINTNQL